MTIWRDYEYLKYPFYFVIIIVVVGQPIVIAATCCCSLNIYFYTYFYVTSFCEKDKRSMTSAGYKLLWRVLLNNIFFNKGISSESLSWEITLVKTLLCIFSKIYLRGSFFSIFSLLSQISCFCFFFSLSLRILVKNPPPPPYQHHHFEYPSNPKNLQHLPLFWVTIIIFCRCSHACIMYHHNIMNKSTCFYFLMFVCMHPQIFTHKNIQASRIPLLLELELEWWWWYGGVMVVVVVVAEWKKRRRKKRSNKSASFLSNLAIPFQCASLPV